MNVLYNDNNVCTVGWCCVWTKTNERFPSFKRIVARALHEVDPESYERRRQNSLDRTNPTPYRPLYFGHKLHIDQNEKLVSFGIMTVASRDGYSGMIVSFGVMPIKNNLAIYDLVYKYLFIVVSNV